MKVLWRVREPESGNIFEGEEGRFGNRYDGGLIGEGMRRLLVIDQSSLHAVVDSVARLTWFKEFMVGHKLMELCG